MLHQRLMGPLCNSCEFKVTNIRLVKFNKANPSYKDFWEYQSMSKKRKRISRRRLAGQRVMAHVPIYHIETGKHKPVTAARRFIAENALSAPSVFNVRRNEHTTDRFFWGEKGLFSAQYAEENHFLFPSLKVVVEGIGEEKIFEGLELTADDWEEIEEYEYAFV